MIIKHKGKTPSIHPTSYVAPNAVLSGDVIIGQHCSILYGAVITSEGGPVTIGDHCVIMENAVIRATNKFPTILNDHILIGPRAYLTGCIIKDYVFLATGTTVFNGAIIGERSEVRINGVVHLKTKLLPDTMVPIGWLAVGDPAEILPPEKHDRIWEIQKELNFPKEIFGIERSGKGDPTMMRKLTTRYSDYLSSHGDDILLDQ